MSNGPWWNRFCRRPAARTTAVVHSTYNTFRTPSPQISREEDGVSFQRRQLLAPRIFNRRNCVQGPCSARGRTPKTLGTGQEIALLSFSLNEVSKLPYSSISSSP